MEVCNTKLYINGRWQLTDLNVLTRVYIQLYGLLYSLNFADGYLDQGIQDIYIKYPWRGGFSAVNFYQNLFTKIPQSYKPQIKSIQYASPGFIELYQLREVATDIAFIVGCVSAAIISCNKVYSDIQKGISERKLSKIDLRSEELSLFEKERAFLHKSANEIARVMGIKPEALSKLYLRAGGNELAVVKILSSMYRRARDLAKLQNSDKLDLNRGYADKKETNDQRQSGS